MESSTTIIASALFIFATLICFSLIEGASSIARKIGLVDKPCTRKRHVGDIPLVGGVCVFATLLLLSPLTSIPPALWLLSLVLVVLGTVDDIHNLNARLRLVLQMLIAAVLVLGLDVRIETVGSIVGASPIEFSYTSSVIFSIFCIVGVINAINMIDGADGLTGGILIITLIALLYFSADNTGVIYGLAIWIGALAAFLLFNTGIFGIQKKIFLGDAGSMFFGLMLSYYFISMTQGAEAPLSPVVAGWMFGIPLIDTVSVMVRRITQGRSPFSAGRDHLHHTLIDGGLTVKNTVLTMLLAHSIIILVAIGAIHLGVHHTVLFWGFVALVIIHHFMTSKLLAKIIQMRGPQQTGGKQHA